MARSLASFTLVLLVLLSGCFDGGSDAGPDTDQPVPPSAALAVTPLADTVLVSTPEHRIAEFMVNRNPNDPDHLVTAYGDYDSPGGVLNCGFAVSRDGGATWTVSSPIEGFSGPYLQFDGWVDFDEWGGVHGTCLMQGGPGSVQESWPYYFSSADGGLTWTNVQHIPTDPEGASLDKGVLGVGRDGRVYVAVGGWVGTTADNGTTWVPMSPIMQAHEGRLVDAPFAVLNGFVEDNAGTVFLSGSGPERDVWIMRSTDGGVSWTEAAAGKFFIPPGYNDQNRWANQDPWTALPNLAHDPVSDDLYIVWQSWDTEYDGYRIHLWRSTDHGVTFAPTAVPDFASPTCADPCHVTHPAVAFDQEGRLGMIVQLTREGGHLKEVYFSASADEGATWTKPFELNKADGMGPTAQGWSNPNAFAPLPGNAQAIAAGLASDPTTAHNIAVGLALTSAVSELQMRWNGEYWGLSATSKGFVAMWIDHSNDGRPQLYSRLLAVE
jgi:hypothetical protein